MLTDQFSGEGEYRLDTLKWGWWNTNSTVIKNQNFYRNIPLAIRCVFHVSFMPNNDSVLTMRKKWREIPSHLVSNMFSSSRSSYRYCLNGDLSRPWDWVMTRLSGQAWNVLEIRPHFILRHNPWERSTIPAWSVLLGLHPIWQRLKEL